MPVDKGGVGGKTRPVFKKPPPRKKPSVSKPDALVFGADVGLFTPPALIPPPGPVNPDLNKVPVPFPITPTPQQARVAREAATAKKTTQRARDAVVAPVSTAARVRVRRGETKAEKKARTGTQPKPKKTKGWLAREKSLWGNVLQGLGDAGEGLVRAGAEGLLSAAWDAESSGSRVPAGAAGALAGATAATDVLTGATIGKDIARLAAGAAYNPTGAKIDVALLPFLAIGRPFKGLKAARAAAKAARAGRPLDEIADVAEAVYKGGRVAEAAPSERVFYRGTQPGDERRIRTGFQEWDDNLFVADNEADARLYGPNIERVAFKPEARILEYGTPEWTRVAVPHSEKDWATKTIGAAKAAGYDAVKFKDQGAFGTVVVNEDAVIRNYQGGRAAAAVAPEPSQHYTAKAEARTFRSVEDAQKTVEKIDDYLYSVEHSPPDSNVAVALDSERDAAERYIAAHTLDPEIADTRLDELAGFLEPFIDDAYKALRQADPSSTIGADKRVRRVMSDADRAKTHAIGTGTPVEMGDKPLIQPQVGPEVDRDRAEKIIFEAAKRSDSPVAKRIVEAFEEIEAINGALTHRAETDFLAALDPHASAQADEAQAWLDGLALEAREASATPGLSGVLDRMGARTLEVDATNRPDLFTNRLPADHSIVGLRNKPMRNDLPAPHVLPAKLVNGRGAAPPRVVDTVPIPGGFDPNAQTVSRGWGTEKIVPGSERPPEAVYRAVSEDDWQQMQRSGQLLSDGRMNLSADEGTVATLGDPSFYLPGALASDQPGVFRGRILKIQYDDADGWVLDRDGYVKTTKPIPLDRVTASPLLERTRGVTASGGPDLGSWRVVSDQPAPPRERTLVPIEGGGQGGPPPPRPTAISPDPGDPGYRARTLTLGEHEQQLVRARSRITQQGERLVDKISKSLDPTWVSRTPGARVMTVGARVPKHAGRGERHMIVRRPAKVGTAIKTLHKVDEGSMIDEAHFWYAQLPEAYRNAEGLKLVRAARAEELDAITSGESLAKLTERKEMLRVLQLDAETKGQAMRLQGQIEDVQLLITDLPRRATDVAASIRNMDNLILHSPENDDAIIQSLREVGDERKKTLISEGRLDPERATEREGLVARWLGLEPDGTEIYMGHRLPPDTLSRSRVQQVSAGTGRVASPRGVGSRNRLVLATTGRVRPSVHVALEDYAASQVFETAMNARKFLGSIGKPFDIHRGYQKGYTLINPKARTVPPHLRAEELVNFSHTGDDMDEIRGMAQDVVDSFTAKNKGDWERLIEEAAENGVKWDELRVVPDYQVERYYKQFRSFSGRSTAGVGYDMAVDAMATSIVFARLGYIPKNIVQNIIMSVPHQGAWLPINAVRSAQIMLHPKFRELRNMARAEIGSSGAARALAGESAKRGPTKTMLNAVAGFVGSIADDPARLSAFLHEAMAEGVISKKNPLLTERDADALIDLLTNSRHERKLNDIMHRSTEAMADFTRLTPDQARMARRFLIIPGWLMAGSRYPFHFAATHPIRSALMAYIAMGEPGAPDELQFNDRIDTYFNGRDYLRGIDTPWGRVRTGSLNPVSTPWDLAQSVAGSVRGREGPFDYETPTAFDWANPFAAEAIAFLRGETELSKSAKRLFPGLQYLKDQISPTDDPKRYPEDVTRIGRLKRELGVVPIDVQDELDEDLVLRKPGSRRGGRSELRKPGGGGSGLKKPGS